MEEPVLFLHQVAKATASAVGVMFVCTHRHQSKSLFGHLGPFRCWLHSCLFFDPAEEFGDPGVNARSVFAGTALTPTDHSSQEHTFPLFTGQRTARVALKHTDEEDEGGRKYWNTNLSAHFSDFKWAKINNNPQTLLLVKAPTFKLFMIDLLLF